jgi:hypothetical protein
MPTDGDWSNIIEFKPVEKGATVGLINFSSSFASRPSGIRLIEKGDEPITARTVQVPLECYTIDQVMQKGKGHLVMSIELTPRLWTLFNGLDKAFDTFMVENRTKLFTAADAAFIEKDPSSITLKHPKPLARFNADGTPAYGSLLRLRIMGRGSEISELETKDGREGQYVSNIKYKPRIEPLGSATHFAMVTGEEAGTIMVCETMRIERPADHKPQPGEYRTRYVGPGDFTGGVLHSCIIKPSHWAIVNGAATICIALVSCIFKNVKKTAELPEGFAVKNDDEVLMAPKKRSRFASVSISTLNEIPRLEFPEDERRKKEKDE